MEPKRIYLILLSAFLIFSGLQIVRAINWSKDITYYGNATGGAIYFDYDFYSSSQSYVSDCIVFANFELDDNDTYTWLGFGNNNTGATLNISAVWDAQITLTPRVYNGSTEYYVYLLGKGEPDLVNGTETYSYGSNILTLEPNSTNGNETILLLWDIIVWDPFNLTNVFITDPIGGVINFWGFLLGDALFSLLISFALAIPLYIRSQSIELIAGSYVLVGYVLQKYIPALALETGRILMIIGVAVFILKLWLGRREVG